MMVPSPLPPPKYPIITTIQGGAVKGALKRIKK